MMSSVTRDRIYWTSGFVNGVMMAGCFYVLYHSIKSAIDDRVEEKQYLANVRKAKTPFGPVKSQQYQEFLRRLEEERWGQMHGHSVHSHISK